MTVEDFIRVLKKYPQGVEIRINYLPDFDIEYDPEYYDGDSANPDCPVIEAVVIS